MFQRSARKQEPSSCITSVFLQEKVRSSRAPLDCLFLIYFAVADSFEQFSVLQLAAFLIATAASQEAERDDEYPEQSEDNHVPYRDKRPRHKDKAESYRYEQ